MERCREAVLPTAAGVRTSANYYRAIAETPLTWFLAVENLRLKTLEAPNAKLTELINPKRPAHFQCEFGAANASSKRGNGERRCSCAEEASSSHA